MPYYWRRDTSDEHVACIAPTRSGKGVGQVIPTLLSWPGSVLVHDMKGENWAITSAWRAKFSHVIYFNPTDPQCSAHFNPLFEVRADINQVRDVQNIADQLVDPHGAGKDSHWDRTARQLFVGGHFACAAYRT
jgi:type IV secretion system protein VirD4